MNCGLEKTGEALHPTFCSEWAHCLIRLMEQQPILSSASFSVVIITLLLFLLKHPRNTIWRKNIPTPAGLWRSKCPLVSKSNASYSSSPISAGWTPLKVIQVSSKDQAALQTFPPKQDVLIMFPWFKTGTFYSAFWYRLLSAITCPLWYSCTHKHKFTGK